MRKLGILLSLLVLVASMGSALPSVSLAEGGGIGNGDCPDGYSLVARYEWDGFEYKFDSDSGSHVVTFSGDSDDTGGYWESGTFMDYMVLKNGHESQQGPTILDYSYYYDPPVTEGDFTNEGLQGHEISHIDFCINPTTAIELISFTAQPLPRGRVLLAWETGTEVDNAGFNLYRATAEEGPYTRIAGLIPAKGSPVAGARYWFLDKPGFGRFFYQLEDVDIYGGSTMHGPVKAVVLPRPRQ